MNENELNLILKRLFETDFFKNINLSFNNNLLLINVEENPIIENINYDGIKKIKLLDEIKKNSLIKSRSSYKDFKIKQEKKRIQKKLLDKGYYANNVDIFVEEKKNNLINLTIKFELGPRRK